MLSHTSVYIALVLFSAANSVQAANDWSKPCFQGDCSWDVPVSNSSIPGSLRVWGSPNAISDVTEAGGWIILGCDQNASAQDIRLVCKSDDSDAAGCSHIHQGGADETLVRLPASCGKGPFARVARSWISENQTVPAWAVKKMQLSNKRRLPQVHALALDTNFAASSGAKHGPVSFAVIGTSAQSDGIFDIPRSTNLRRDLDRRSLFGSIGKVFGGVTSAIGGAVKGAVKGAASVVKGAAGAVKGAAESVNNVNIDKKKTLPHISVDKSFNLVNVHSDCGKIGQINVKVDADVNAQADVSLGIVGAGTIIPPKVKTFSLQAGLSADLKGDITVSASASGAPIDTGVIQLFSVGIPGLDIPDILQIGPAFAIKGRANLDLSIEADMKIALAYSVNNAVFAFPPNKNLPSSGSPSPKDSPLALSVSPSVAAKGTFQAHLIPELNFGVTALGKVASATVFLNLDSFAQVDLTFNAAATGISTQIGGKKTAKKSRMLALPASEVAEDVTDSEAEAEELEIARRAAVAINGCVDMKLGVDANVGAQGSFFGLFDASKNFVLFSKDFELFKKCFGNGAATRRAVDNGSKKSRSYRASSLQVLAARKTFNLACPIKAAPKAEKIVDETVKASAIKKI